MPSTLLTSPIGISVAAGLLAVVVGFPVALFLGWTLARRTFRGKTLLTCLVLFPLVLPPVVTGYLLLTLLGASGLVSNILDNVGIRVPFNFLGVVVAATVVGMPLYVMSIRAAFESVDRRYEEVAASLGKSPRQCFWTTSLPLAVPGIAAGAVLMFARSLGEFGATIVLAGNIPGRTQTIPTAIYESLNSPRGDSDGRYLTLTSLGISLLSLLAYEGFRRAHARRLDT